MSDLNQCTFIGRCGADPEIRRSQGGDPIANMRIAVSETWRDKATGERKEKTEWISVVAFGAGLCKIVESYVKKGSKILIQGKMQTRRWQDQSGADRYSTEIVLGLDGKLMLLDAKPAERGAEPAKAREEHGSHPANFDDDIPFLMEWRG